MARCGADYWSLIKTPDGGTPEQPLTGLDNVVGMPSPEAWWGWRRLAEQLSEKAEAQFKRLGDVEGAKLKSVSWPEWNKNITAQNELHAAREAMGSFFMTAPVNGIPQAIAVCEAAVCLLEGVDRSLAVYGEASHSSPGPKEPTTGDKVTGLVVLGLLGYGLYKLDAASGDE